MKRPRFTGEQGIGMWKEQEAVRRRPMSAASPEYPKEIQHQKTVTLGAR
jgi:hypothetical protein